MSMRISRIASGAALAAALSMAATPALADGWGGGWGGGYGHHHHDDDTGWIVGGVIGLGMIAALAAGASSSNRAKREREARNRDYRYPDDNSRRDGYRYGDTREGSSNRYSYSAGRIDGAVDSCINEIERGNSRVDTVDTVGREGDGWRIQGRIGGGRDFACSVDGNGRIRSATVDGRAIG